jgi:hypothetical protein
MKSWKVIAPIPAIVMLVLTFFSSGALKIEDSVVQSIIIAVAVAAMAMVAYIHFECRRMLLYIALGMALSIGGSYVALNILWEPYPQIAMVLLPLAVLVGAICSFLGAVEAIRMLKNVYGAE